MSEKASVPAARNISNAMNMVLLSPNISPNTVPIMSIGQILKLTMRYMMKLPIPIQQPASPRHILVRSSCQTLP
jgi:hypothetical protein